MSNSTFLGTQEANNCRETYDLQTTHSPPADSEKLPIEQDSTTDVSAATGGGDSKEVAASNDRKMHTQSFLMSLSGDSAKCLKIWQRVELCIVLVLVVVVWGLLFLPLIFYHIPDEAPPPTEVNVYIPIICCLSVLPYGALPEHPTKLSKCPEQWLFRIGKGHLGFYWKNTQQ